LKCGSVNPEFSEDALEEEYKTRSITEVRQCDCPVYHSAVANESLGETPEEILDFLKECPFCPHCGINILKMVLH